jgi:hypothetical protein
LRGKAARAREEKESCIDRPELQVVGLGGEELILLDIGFHPID